MTNSPNPGALLFYNRSQDWSVSTMCNIANDNFSYNPGALLFYNRIQDWSVSTLYNIANDNSPILTLKL